MDENAAVCMARHIMISNCKTGKVCKFVIDSTILGQSVFLFREPVLSSLSSTLNKWFVGGLERILSN